MIRDVIRKAKRKLESHPFEVGGVYFNEDVQDQFVVESLDPFEIRYSKKDTGLHFDYDVYVWKYENGKIWEVDDGD